MQIIKKIGYISLSILTLVGLFILEQIALAPYDIPALIKLPQTAVFFGILGTIFSIGIIALLIYFYHKWPPIKTFLHPVEHKTIVFIILVFSMFLIQILSNYIPTSKNQNILDQEFATTPWLSSISTVLIAPICEELIFRGLFFRLLLPKMNNKWTLSLGIGLSTFVFAWLHESAFILELLPYLAMGFVLTLTYVIYNDIRYDIGLHMLNNFMAMLLNLL